MNQHLTGRDRDLLEIVFNKIIKKQDELNATRNKANNKNRCRELELKECGLSIATDIISDMIWNENEDYFKEEVDVIQLLNSFKKEISLSLYGHLEIKYYYDEEEKVWFITYSNSAYLNDKSFSTFIGKMLRSIFYSNKIYNICFIYEKEKNKE